MATKAQDTLAGQIKTLKVGASISRTARIDLSAKGRTRGNENLAVLRNQINQAVGRIRKEQPDSSFRVESAIAVTDDKKALLATVAVTKIEGIDTEDESDEETDI
jgi:hypothetical protein